MKMSDVSRFKAWCSERMGHPLGVILGIDAVSELESEVERLESNQDRMAEELKSKTDMLALVVEEKSRMVEEIAELKGALREARGALSACSIQESRNDGSENRMKIKALDKQVYEIDSLLAKLNQEGEE